MGTTEKGSESMLRFSKKLFQAFAVLAAFLILCSGLVTLSQWKETWIASSLLFAFFLANFLFVATFLQIVAMVNLFLLLRFFPDPTIALIRALEGHFLQPAPPAAPLLPLVGDIFV